AQYLAAGLAYGPRGGPFPHTDELRLVRDLPPDLVELALPFVTVFNGAAEINVRQAPPEVIPAIPGLTQDRLNSMLQARQSVPGPPRARSASLDPSQSGTSTEASKAFRVKIRIAFDNGRRVFPEAVIATLDDADAPYRILSWRDGFDEPSERRAQ